MSERCDCQNDEGCTCQEGSCQCGCNCHAGCDCGCCSGHFQRRYQTRQEQISDLEAYLAELKLEVQAVEEHLADLRKA